MINYNTKPFKREYQKFFFGKVIEKRTFIGLCGPNPKGYLLKIWNAGFRHVFLLDKNKANLENISELVEFYAKKGMNLKLINRDINDYLNVKNAFFDLDYCNNIKTIDKYLPQISKLKEFTLTVSIRSASEEDTIKRLFAFNRIFYQRRCRGSRNTQLMMMFYFPPINKTL